MKQLIQRAVGGSSAHVCLLVEPIVGALRRFTSAGRLGGLSLAATITMQSSITFTC